MRQVNAFDPWFSSPAKSARWQIVTRGESGKVGISPLFRFKSHARIDCGDATGWQITRKTRDRKHGERHHCPDICGSPTFFLPVQVLHQVFRGKFIDGLRHAFTQNRLNFSGLIQHLAEAKSFAEFVRKLHRQEWIVYTKPSFGGPEQVLRYLGRYTHRVAISNHRLVSFDGDQVAFRWKDYAHGNKKRKMTVSAEEFIRRFLLHVLPKGFVRTRHFGFMANSQRSRSLELCRRLLNMAPIAPTETTCNSARLCSTCRGPIVVIEKLNPAQLRWRFLPTCFPDTS
jgi:Putative transposase